MYISFTVKHALFPRGQFTCILSIYIHCPSLSHESILVAITAPKPQTARAKPPHLLLYVFSMGRELWLSKLKLDTREKCMRTK